MKALGRLIGELVGWRWAPAVGLCVASLFYVLVVVALVPEEIGVPTTNARLATPKVASQPSEPELPTFPTAMPESETPPMPAPVRPAAVVDFGRRGFSPPLDRPEAPPPPAPPPPPVAPTPVVPPAAAMNIPPPQPGSAAAADQAALAAEAAAAQATPAAPPPTPPVAMNPLQRILRAGAIPHPGVGPSAQPGPPGAAPGAPPGAAPGAPPGAGGGPPATPPNQ